MIKCILSLMALAVMSSAMTFAQQPKWAKKMSKSVFTIKTFGSDGIMKASTNGFFISTDGVGVSNFSPFKGANKAVIIDAEGKEWPITCILGANDLYDLVKFKVDIKKAFPLTGKSNATSQDSTLWLLPYSAKKTPTCIKGKVSKTEILQDDYTYYTLNMVSSQTNTSCPLFNSEGQLVAMLQSSPNIADTTVCYGISSGFAASLKLSGLSINDPVLKSTFIKKGLPDELNQAILTMYVAPSVLDSATYVELMNDFISKFPQVPDGYVTRAQWYASNDKFAEADMDISQAFKIAEKKDDVHFNYAKLIYQKEITKPQETYPSWSYDKAVKEIDEAYAINPLPAYHELKAQIQFARHQYDDAYALYEELSKTSLRSAEIFFAAARCKEMVHDTISMIALLDSAVNTFEKPYLKVAAPYILVRAQALMNAGKYRKAVIDFNDYEKLMPTEVNDNFYYIREQCEINGHLYQQALTDIQTAIMKAPKTSIYYAEKASIEIRVGQYDAAIKTSMECIDIDNQLSDGYLFLGLAQCLKGQKAEGRQNLMKAKELGNNQADELIEKYGK